MSHLKEALFPNPKESMLLLTSIHHSSLSIHPSSPKRGILEHRTYRRLANCNLPKNKCTWSHLSHREQRNPQKRMGRWEHLKRFERITKRSIGGDLHVVFGHELYTVVAMLHGDCSWVLKDQRGHDADILARFAVSEVERI